LHYSFASAFHNYFSVIVFKAVYHGDILNVNISDYYDKY
jgi:hypothetical protein